MAKKQKKSKPTYEVDFIYSHSNTFNNGDIYTLTEEQVAEFEECMQDGTTVYQFNHVNAMQQEQTIYINVRNVARACISVVDEEE